MCIYTLFTGRYIYYAYIHICIYTLFTGRLPFCVYHCQFVGISQVCVCVCVYHLVKKCKGICA